MGDSDFDFNEWLGYGLAGGMFNFGVGPFADIQDLSYEDAIKVANDLYSVALQDGEISKEAGRQAIEKLSFVDYFLGLLKDGGEDVFGVEVSADKKEVCIYDKKDPFCNQLVIHYLQTGDISVMKKAMESKKTTHFPTIEAAGVYVLKWIVSYLS